MSSPDAIVARVNTLLSSWTNSSLSKSGVNKLWKRLQFHDAEDKIEDIKNIRRYL